MISQQTDLYKCRHCWNPLEPNHKGPCPICGKIGAVKTIQPKNVVVETAVTKPKLGIIKTAREYYKVNHRALRINIEITILLSFLGYFISGLLGTLVSLVLAILYCFISPAVIIKIKEIKRE